MKKHGSKPGQVDPDIFISKSNELIRQLRYPRRRLFTGRKPMTELDSGVLQSAVSKIVITNKGVTVTLKNGQTIERRDKP